MTDKERVNKWRTANREKVRAYNSERWANDPKYRAAQQARRAQPGYRTNELEYQKNRRKNPDKWPTVILLDIRRRCRKNGIPFDLIPSDIVVPRVCPILLVPFVFGEVGRPHSPSVDRYEPSKGYVKGNVRVISRQANTMKSNCTDPAVFRRIADWLES